MKREPGFYWVKWSGEWEVCEWTGKNWLLPGVDIEIYATDEDMEQLDERRIINPNE